MKAAITGAATHPSHLDELQKLVQECKSSEELSWSNPNFHNQTILHVACSEPSEVGAKTVKILVGATVAIDVDKLDDYGATAIMHAASHQLYHSVENILKARPETKLDVVGTKDNFANKTVLDLAAQCPVVTGMIENHISTAAKALGEAADKIQGGIEAKNAAALTKEERK